MMTLLVDASASPNGIGILQVDGDLQVFSVCCGSAGWVKWSYDLEAWICSLCKEKTPFQPYDSTGTSIWRNVITEQGQVHILKWWIAIWVGVQTNEIEVSINGK